MRVSTWGRGVIALVLAFASAQAASGQVDTALVADSDAAAIVEAAPSLPEQHRAMVDALIANDIEAVVIQMSGESQEKLAREWERDRLRHAKSEHSSPVDVVVARFWTMLSTPAGTVELANELHPAFVLNANKAVAEFNGEFPKMLSELASDEEFSPEEVPQLSQLALAVQRWANGMDWQDRARFDRALDAIAGFVRRSGVQTPSEIPLLPYEEAAALGDDAIVTIKRVLRAYDLDADTMLRTVMIDELSRDGDAATVRWSARVLDVPITITREMHYDRKYGGRWMTAKQLEQINRWMEESEAVDTAEDAETEEVFLEPPPSADTGSCGKSAGSESENRFWSEKKAGEG